MSSNSFGLDGLLLDDVYSPVATKLHLGLEAHPRSGYILQHPVPLCTLAETKDGVSGAVHVQSYDVSVGVIVIPVVVSCSIHQVLQPQDIVQPVLLVRHVMFSNYFGRELPVRHWWT